VAPATTPERVTKTAPTHGLGDVTRRTAAAAAIAWTM
jgi:hypothetical protein